MSFSSFVFIALISGSGVFFVLFLSGFSIREREPVPRAPEVVSQGDPSTSRYVCVSTSEKFIKVSKPMI